MAVEINRAGVILFLDSLYTECRDYVKAVEAYYDRMSKLEQIQEELEKANDYPNRVYSGYVPNHGSRKMSLDVVLEHLNDRWEDLFEYFLQDIHDLHYMYEEGVAKFWLQFVFLYSRSFFPKEYRICKMRYVEHIKVDEIRKQMGIRKATVCSMAADEIHLIMIMYTVLKCSETGLDSWKSRFGLQTILEIVTHPEKLTAEEQLYINMDELREYAQARLTKNERH